MQFSCLQWIVVWISAYPFLIHAQTLSSQKRSTNCALLIKNIYCFGQDSSTSNNSMSIRVLNIKNNKGTTVDFLNLQWRTIVGSNSTGVSIVDRIYPQVAVINDGKQILFNGGYNLRNSSIVDQTVIYNPEKNTWIKGPNYVDENNVTKQIFSGSAVYIPSRGIAFFGGQEQHIDPVVSTSTNISVPSAGYSKLTMYDPLNSVWSIPTPQTNLPTTTFSFHQSSIYYAATKTIYYFGGLYHDTASPTFNINNPSKHSMSYFITFNTNTGIWGKENLAGAVIPTSRLFHTTTLLPVTGRDVLLYGGSDGVTQSNDYCYTLNLDNKMWTQQNINAPNDIAILRSHHAAVLANDLSLFILSDPLSQQQNSIIVLDVSRPSSILYADTYNDLSSSGDTASYYPQNESSSDKNRTIIIVVVVCSTVGAILAVLLFVYFWLKKRRSYRKREEGTNRIEQTELDEIRNQFPQQYNHTQVQPMQTMPKPYVDNSEPPPPYQPTRDFPQSVLHEGESQINGSRHYDNSRPRTMVNHAPNVPSTQTNWAPQSTSHGLSSTRQSYQKKVIPR